MDSEDGEKQKTKEEQYDTSRCANVQERESPILSLSLGLRVL